MSASPPQDFCRDPFDDTLNAIISGDASARDHVILNDTLRSDPEARRTYIRTMAFEAMLAREFAPLEEMQVARPRRRWMIPAAIAASILLVTGLAWRFQLSITEFPVIGELMIEGNEEVTHAVISSLENASGNFGELPISQGMRLNEGMLNLASGLVEITFDTGAEVTLEGPAKFQLESDNKGRLDAGRASAQVPEQAYGFVIHTPSSYIRDLGTAFALEVRNDQETDLHVLEGEVEVEATGRNSLNRPKILRQKEAVRLGGGNMSPISFSNDSPGGKRQARIPTIPPFVHWSFDSWDGSVTSDSSLGYSLKLQQKANPSPSPEMLEGPFGFALHLDGEGKFARSDYFGGGESKEQTVACWLRIQPGDSINSEPQQGVVSWANSRQPAKWQLVLNKAQAQGSVGALRVEYGEGFIIGSTDLRDGRWHHLTIVCLHGSKTNVATHVKIYVDGKLEIITGRQSRRIDTTSATAEPTALTIGRSLGRNHGFFQGDIDELHFFEGALLPGQINRLMKRNTIRVAKP
jgi:hypothetical protein